MSDVSIGTDEARSDVAQREDALSKDSKEATHAGPLDEDIKNAKNTDEKMSDEKDNAHTEPLEAAETSSEAREMKEDQSDVESDFEIINRDELNTETKEMGQENQEELDGESRNRLYQKAETLLGQEKFDEALDCYLKCVKGLEKGSGFLYLPQCLHQIAEVYHKKEEDDKAIQFLKAEKIYYETALLDTKTIQEKLDEMSKESGDSDGQKTETEQSETEILRAAEYESLANLCVEKQQFELALEFCGKATKIYQQHHGDEHPTTQRALNLLTSVYAEVGKEEYSAKLKQYETEQTHMKGEDNSSSNVRRRKIVDVPHTSEQEEQESSSDPQNSQNQPSVRLVPRSGDNSLEMGKCALCMLWTLLFVCGITALLLFGIVYCRSYKTSWFCHQAKVQFKSFSDNVGFMMYKWSGRRV